MTAQNGTRALVYIRVSSGFGVDGQRERCLREAMRAGWRVEAGDVYIDVGTEGGRAWRALRRRLLDDQSVAAVIAQDQTRVSQQRDVWLAIAAELRDLGVELRTPSAS
ncbi:MAG: recombinase family protein [Anaerolineae bacterium]|nr:recombinase family protein [Anaerolineae bacterium]